MQVLLVEDDRLLAERICARLVADAHVVDSAANVAAGLSFLRQNTYDLLILDRHLPDADGRDVMLFNQATQKSARTIFITASSCVDERIALLKAGADDYLVKPFVVDELLARMEAIVRRKSDLNVEQERYVGDMVVDVMRREVLRAGKPIRLSDIEFRLLHCLLNYKGKVVTREIVLRDVWGFDFDPKTTLVETHLSRLRAKIDKGHKLKLIRNHRGVGYSINDTHSV